MGGVQAQEVQTNKHVLIQETDIKLKHSISAFSAYFYPPPQSIKVYYPPPPVDKGLLCTLAYKYAT